ncbi:MAG: NAD-dependent epimerase/dehydratase family protein [Vicinamibacterales bacterium]
MRILLTGIDGYLGALMGPHLLARGHDVIGLDSGYYRDGLFYRLPDPPIPTITKDVRHITVADLRGFDAVVHLAELSNDPIGQNRPQVTYAINGDGSGSLARHARAAGVRRFVYSSSCSVYGAGGPDWKTEESPTEPLTAYAECKLRTEAVLGLLADDWFSPTCLRNATAHGASPRMRFDIVLNQFAGLAWTTGQIVMVSDGTPWRPLVHALDIAEAFACVLEAPRDAVHNQIFNVGCNEENYRVRELAAIVAAVFPGTRTAFGTPAADGRSYRVSFDKIARMVPAFRCRRTAAGGAAELREIFERIAMTSETFNFRGFTRLRQLHHLLDTGQMDENFFMRTQPAAA